MKNSLSLIILVLFLVCCSKENGMEPDQMPDTNLTPTYTDAVFDESLKISQSWITPYSVGITIEEGKVQYIILSSEEIQDMESIVDNISSYEAIEIKFFNKDIKKICKINAVFDFLEPETTYYIYPLNIPEEIEKVNIPKYGSFIKITTPSDKKLYDEIVDLNLSRKWRNRNLLSNDPWDSGEQFIWGNIYPTKCHLIPDPVQGDWYYYSPGIPDIRVDNICGTHNDAAYKNLGTHWKMPTDNEIQELRRKTTIHKVYAKGKVIYECKGSNGNILWLPASSYTNYLVDKGIIYTIGKTTENAHYEPYFWSGERERPSMGVHAFAGENMVLFYSNIAVPIRPVYVD